MVNFDLGHIEVCGLEPGGGVLPAQHLAGGGRAPAQVVGPRAGLDIVNNIMHENFVLYNYEDGWKRSSFTLETLLRHYAKQVLSHGK